MMKKLMVVCVCLFGITHAGFSKGSVGSGTCVKVMRYWSEQFNAWVYYNHTCQGGSMAFGSGTGYKGDGNCGVYGDGNWPHICDNSNYVDDPSE